jgi:hypothetical protein
VTPATDWWGWGSTLAFAASGRSPFGSGPVEVVLDRVRQGRPDLTGIDPRLARVLEAALAPDPSRRPPGHVLVAMLRAAGGAPAPAFPPTAVLRDAPRTQAHAPAPLPAPMALPGTRMDAAPPQGVQAPPAQRPPAALPAAPPAAPERRTSPAWSTGVLLALLAALAGAATVAPGAVVVGFVVLAALARTIDRSAAGMWRRRNERGPRPSDTAVTVLALPWRLLMATVASVLAALLPALVALAGAFITASSVAGGRAVLPSSGPALAAGAVAGALTAWWGPGGGSLRRGSRHALRAVVPTRAVAVVLALLLVAGGVGGAVLRAGGRPPDPAPFHSVELPWWLGF